MLLLFFLYIAYAENPYEGAAFFVNPHYQAEVDDSIAAHPDKADLLEKARDIGAAIWLDSIQVMNDNLTNYLEAANKQAHTETTVVQFIVYDLPNRDCAAEASNGELHCVDSTCTDALNRYRTEYINVIAHKLADYTNPDLHIVLIIEPDSLPNLATNVDMYQKCRDSATAYKSGCEYAIKTLSPQDNTYLYVDAAHGGWLGWDNNRAKALGIWNEVMKNAGGWNLIRGFATNVANYQPLGTKTDTKDPCDYQSQYNFAYNECRYINLLQEDFQNQGIDDIHFITDTGRNGQETCRVGKTECQMWCNPAGAGMGRRPEASPSGLGIQLDAVSWLKTPGESDGVSDPNAPRYDSTCGSSNSFKPSPQAGKWNDAQFVELCDLANPPLGKSPSPGPTPTPGPDPTPTPKPGTCSKTYDQCGGNNWDGPTCCYEGCTCTANGEWYSQCVPDTPGGTCTGYKVLRLLDSFQD